MKQQNKNSRLFRTVSILALVAVSAGAAWSARSMIEIGPLATLTSGGQPELQFNDLGDGGNDSDWEIEAVASATIGDRFQIGIEGGGDEPFRIFAGADEDNLVLDNNGNVAINGPTTQLVHEFEIFGNTGATDSFTAMALSPGGFNSESARFFISALSNIAGIGVRDGSGGYYSPFQIDTSAQMNAALVIDKQGDVGIGVNPLSVDPAADLHVGGAGYLLLDGYGSTDWWLHSNNPEGSFNLRSRTTGNAPVKVFNNAANDSLVLSNLGFAGFGTSIPDTPIHVLRSDGNAGFKVEENSPVVARRQLFELVNNGGVQFALDNLDTGERWDFTNNSVGDFLVNRVGTGGPELTVTKAGRMFSGPAGFAALDSRPNGNLFIQGTLFESSDRNKKENFEEVNCDRVLEQIAELPITTWNYKSDDESIRHMGPVAQDFHAAFALGDSDVTIATTDKVGISLAAIKALNAKLEAWDSEIDAKDARIEELESELSDVADRLGQLEIALEQIVDATR